MPDDAEVCELAETEASKPARHWFHVPVQVAVAALWVYWYWHVPAPNKAALCLAAVAAIMALVEMRPLHKALYFALIIGLLFVENRAIDKDRREFAEAEACRRQEENAEFSAIGTAITTNVQKLLDDSGIKFNKTMEEFGENIKTITGGNSFPIVEVPLLPVDNANKFRLILQVHGKYDLQDVQVEVAQLPEPGFGTPEWFQHTLAGTNQNLQSAALGNVSHTAGKMIPIFIYPATDGSITEYSINVYSRNRATHEILRIRNNNGKWESSFKVIDSKGNKVLQQSKPEWRGTVLVLPK